MHTCSDAHMLAAGCTCAVSGPCLSANHEALVLAAARHAPKIWFNQLLPHGLPADFEYWYNTFYYFVSCHFSFVPKFMFSFLSKNQLLDRSSVKRKGLTCHFRHNYPWEPEITPWEDPLELVNGYEKWTVHDKSVALPKRINMKLTTDMLTTTGFTATQLGDEALQTADERAKAKPRGKPYYVGISGGGWRALAGHVGAFRALSNTNTLGMVDMFSSVSGGTWFLTKLAFDAKFSQNVLRNENHITEVVLQWMEREYFPVIRSTTCSMDLSKQISDSENRNTVGPVVSALVLQAPTLLRSALGSAIVAADRFQFSWQKLVEQAVLGQDIADKSLTNISLAPEARTKFGEATLAFNWNQLHQWDDSDPSSCSKWFLRNQTDHQYVQYPVYTSALYKQVTNSNVQFKVKMQGKPLKGLFDVCHMQKDDFCFQPPPPTFLESLKRTSEVVGTISSTIDRYTSWGQSAAPSIDAHKCANFNLGSLTVGQVASASSAAAGGGAVQAWVENVIELVRHKIKDIPVRCTVIPMLIKKLVTPCDRKVIVEQAMTVLGCKSSDGQKQDAKVSRVSIAKKWTAFFQKMAIQMTVNSSLGSHAGHMAIDAVRPTPCESTVMIQS